MNRQKFHFKKEDGGSNSTLEIRLLSFFVAGQFIWSLINGVLALLIGMPQPNAFTYLGWTLLLLVFGTLAHLFKIVPVFAEVFFVLFFIYTPLLWYMAGGGRSSASILFVCELVVYAMCLKGLKQKVYLIFSLMSSGLIQGASRRWPQPVFPMSPEQYQKGGSVLGLTTCVLIASLLLRQKREYMLERDAAIKSEKELEKSNSLQKNFLANMSHEIRSPLGIVMGFNNLIRESNDVEQIHEYSNDIKQAGSTLLTVINDILDYSKIESGKLDIIEEDYSFNSLIEGIIRDIGLKCDDKGLKLVAKNSEDIPDNLFGDSVRIKQCLLNLLTNAVKYTDQGLVIFTVALLEQPSPNEYTIRFIVRDTGRGIDKEALPKIFTAFQRLDEGMNRGIEGTGLGLAITKNLLDEMGGTIEVESKLGTGTTFTVTLTQKLGKNVDTQAIAAQTNILQGVKVLAVDDTQLNLVLLRKLLEKEGAIVTTIDNGKDCLLDVEQHIYDIILLDHMMPEMNGVEVYERMKEYGVLNQTTPVVMVTANAMAGAAQEYAEMGFDGYISKPISAKELRTIVHKLTKGNQV